MFLGISQNSQQITCARVPFSIKLQASKLTIKTPERRHWHRSGVFVVNFEACNFIEKETLAQVFSCEFCEISKKSFSYRTPPMAASQICIITPIMELNNSDSDDCSITSFKEGFYCIVLSSIRVNILPKTESDQHFERTER